MERMRYEIEEDGKGSLLIFVHGRLDRQATGRLWCEAREKILGSDLESVFFDLRDVSGVDSSGVALMRLLEKLCGEQGIDFSSRNLPASLEPFIRYIREHASSHEKVCIPPKGNIASRTGKWVEAKLQGAGEFIRFVGNCLAAIGWCIRNPQHLPVRLFVEQIQVVGADAMPLVILMSALMGMIMIFQGISSMGPATPPVFLADMVAISVTREMAPLLTAVIISGRSGAAFAAEIGIMKINEELDALSVMDFDITRHLVLPRLLAIALACPLLIMLANAAGILGGLITCLGVTDVSPIEFLDEIRKTLGANDIYSGLIKGVAFSAVIGCMGCYRGLRTGITPESVGMETTKAVVSSLILIIMADGLFAALFHLFNF